MIRLLLTLIFMFLQSSILLAVEPVKCGYPNYDNNGGDPNHLVPLFQLENGGDHVLVRVYADDLEGSPEITEKLHPYFMSSSYTNEKSESDYSGPFANIDIYNLNENVDPETYVAPARMGFAQLPGQLYPLSESYNQVFLMWGDLVVQKFAFDPKSTEYLGFNYYYPYEASSTGEMRRVVGDTYYCPKAGVDQLLGELNSKGAVTHYSEESLNLPASDLSVQIELSRFIGGSVCSGDMEEYWSSRAEDRQVNPCLKMRRDLLWVFKFMERYQQEFEFEFMEEQVIAFDDSESSRWIESDRVEGLEVMEIGRTHSKISILCSIQNLIYEKRKPNEIFNCFD